MIQIRNVVFLQANSVQSGIIKSEIHITWAVDAAA